MYPRSARHQSEFSSLQVLVFTSGSLKTNCTYTNCDFRLACPGLWWRVTAIALVLCGKSPNILGYEMWKSSPTIRTLIKMVTSSKFRFPTTDLSESEKEKMREEENKCRDKVSFRSWPNLYCVESAWANLHILQEFEVVEMLFYPNSNKPTKTKTNSDHEQSAKKGSRTSARQREKQERLLAIQREKEKAKEIAG